MTRYHDYIPELDGPQSYVMPGGKRILCKGGGGLLGAIAGAVLAPFTGGMSMLAGAAAGASLGSALIDQPAAAKKAQAAQDQAAQQAQAAADKQAKQAEQAFNRANSRSPDSAAMLSANEQAAKGGTAGTMLTGAMGVDPATLQLGKTTLLGG